MSTAVNIPIYDESTPLPAISGSTPFGYYDGDIDFQNDAPRFTKFAARRMGYPVTDIELQPINFFEALESAVSIYSKELYEYKIRENYISLEGAPTGSTDLNNSLIQPNLGNIIRLAKDYGSEAGSGGNVNYYSGSLYMSASQQYYDLNAWASSSGAIQPGDSIEIKNVFYEAPPAIVRFFDPYAGTGTGMQTLLDSFGFGNMSPGISFMLMPIYFDTMRIQAIEFNDQIRKSAYSFELINNRLRIFPIPTFDRMLWFTYIKNSERNSPIRNASNGLITNISNVPYDHITYSQINSIGRRWIFEYGVALCKETLGNNRGKYSTVPIPGDNVTLNGQDLVSQANVEKENLITQLRATLDDTSRRNQMQKKMETDDMMANTLDKVPMPIYIF